MHSLLFMHIYYVLNIEIIKIVQSSKACAVESHSSIPCILKPPGPPPWDGSCGLPELFGPMPGTGQMPGPCCFYLLVILERIPHQHKKNSPFSFLKKSIHIPYVDMQTYLIEFSLDKGSQILIVETPDSRTT